MKIKYTVTGGEWWVDYIVATNPRTKECRQFYGGYEIIQPYTETPQQSPHVEDLIASNTRAINLNTASIESLNSFGEGILKRVKDLESERAGVAEVLKSYGEEFELITKSQERIVERVQSIESLLISVSERLNAIEGNFG